MADPAAPSLAFVAVDVQPGFCEGGDLPVEGGHEVARRIAAHLRAHGDRYRAVVATRDYHVDPGTHFSEDPDFSESWPPHCVAGTANAELHPELAGVAFDGVFDKGARSAAYSGFEARLGAHEGTSGELLGDWLRRRGITDLDVGGLATDYCVLATARDAVAEGFRVRVMHDLTAGVAPATTDAAVQELRSLGVEVGGSTA